MTLQVGSRFGHYDVTALIGEGGIGKVYRFRMQTEADTKEVRVMNWNRVGPTLATAATLVVVPVGAHAGDYHDDAGYLQQWFTDSAGARICRPY